MTMNGDLPQDLVIEILSRLPVKSLMRFKCVCKSWRTLFKNPTFVAKQYLNNDSDDSLLLNRIDKASDKHVFSLLSNETLDVIENLDFPHHKVDKWVRGLDVVSCCNGIVCMTNVHKEGVNIFLWNPATREFKTLPKSELPRPSNMSAHTGPVGFGFDAKANDYKVVHLPYFTTPSLGLSDNFYQAEIYNLKSGSWRKSDSTVPADVLIIDGAPDVYIHGIYSWIALEEEYGHGPYVDLVVSFDMNKEVIIATSLPDHSNDYAMMITPLNESIALFIHMDHNKWMSGISEVWVLNEYGVKESWTKLYRVGPVLELYRLSGFWKNGDMFVVTYSEKLVSFNPVTLEMKDLQLDSLEHPWFGLYKESLISIN